MFMNKQVYKKQVGTPPPQISLLAGATCLKELATPDKLVVTHLDSRIPRRIFSVFTLNSYQPVFPFLNQEQKRLFQSFDVWM